jgi:hypothetical protein
MASPFGSTYAGYALTEQYEIVTNLLLQPLQCFEGEEDEEEDPH